MNSECSQKPLAGQTIVVTRPREQTEQLVALLEQQGGRIIICPTIIIQPTPDSGELEKAIRERMRYDWVIFTSVNGVRFFSDCARKMGLGPAVFQAENKPRWAAIGPATAELAEREGFAIDLVPREFVAEGLVETFLERFKNLTGWRFLLPRAERARPHLIRQLQENGAEVREIVTYTTISASKMGLECSSALRSGEVDLVTFTSSSTVDGFFSLLEKEKIDLDVVKTRLASIGPITSQTLTKYGVTPAVEATEYTIPGLVRAIIQKFTGP